VGSIPAKGTEQKRDKKTNAAQGPVRPGFEPKCEGEK
tara:strand:+ start:664 stop:774 length:111 start_codon:yes stop_codon:yes gene_type:complete